jgi:soluble lytic murein transglycosylase-like protein
MPLGFASLLVGAIVLIAGITGSSITSVAQGAPDRTHAGAASSTTSSPTTGGTAAPAAAGSWQAELRKLAKAKGWDAGAWEQIISKESGGNPAAVNSSSGAFGLGQFLGATKAEYAKFGSESTNPVEQVRADAKYIEDRYHTPTAALAFHNEHNWY